VLLHPNRNALDRFQLGISTEGEQAARKVGETEAGKYVCDYDVASSIQVQNQTHPYLLLYVRLSLRYFAGMCALSLAQVGARKFKAIPLCKQVRK